MSESCPKPTSTSSQPTTKLTIEELANELGVSKDTLLSEVTKCHDNFKKWSATLGKGTWDFEIEISEGKESILKFQQVIKIITEDEVIQIVSESCPKDTSNPKPTSTLPQPTTKLTVEELANELGVSKDTLLSEVKKCHDNFKKWSATLGKGTWDFEIETSEGKESILKFQQVN